MDLDVHTMAAATLQKNVTQILELAGFLRNLEVHRIGISGVFAAKQTNTTQRWTIHLRASDEPTDILTKIEFSRRNADDEASFDPVDNALIQTYKLYPVFAQHYTREAAFRQKVSSLALRNETQARDVFDLKLLHGRRCGFHTPARPHLHAFGTGNSSCTRNELRSFHRAGGGVSFA
jgi:hypothetical protein